MAANPNGSIVPPLAKAPYEIPPAILDAELAAIRERRKAVRLESSAARGEAESDTKAEEPEIKDKLVGLALSGGGIRSAIFSLGVMQRLAKEGWLEHVDYLSTVSGGGYIGGALTWFLSAPAGKLENGGAFRTTSAKFPYGVDDPRKKRRREDESNILKHLRLHGKYLTPGKGITTTSLIAVVLRGVLLNFVVWLPLAVTLMVGLLFAFYGYEHPSWDAIRNVTADALKNERGLGSLLYLAGLMGMAFLVVSVVYSLATWRPILKKRYLGRRWVEKWIRWPLLFGLFFAVLGSLPAVAMWLKNYVEEAGAASLLLGIGGGLSSFVRSGSKEGGKISLGVLAPLASILFFYGLALTAYWLALFYFEDARFKWVLLVALAVSLVTGWFVNLNYISIHRYYRDRLMEAFMPNPNTDGTTAAAEGANKAKLSDMWSAQAAHAPYHLVNTNVVLVDSDDHKWRIRGGDAFLLSPKYCGSVATGGWVPTADYMKQDPLTLATAVAISGAAANPNTGSGGAGPTRNPALSLLMSLLNVRLGYWVPRPGEPRKVANHFRAAYHELSSRGYAEHQKLLQLSDGAHFENLAMYELVRRKVKLIICCDGGADHEFTFEDLQVLVRRIGTDFGAKLEFDDKNRLEQLIPRHPDPEKVRARDPDTDAYPVGVKFAERGHIKGTIVYPDNTESTLILLKTTMIQRLGLLLKGYKGANPDFPDQSTADQFFEEEQFEAYRELGYEIAKRMINDHKDGNGDKDDNGDKTVTLRALLDACTPAAGPTGASAPTKE